MANNWADEILKEREGQTPPTWADRLRKDDAKQSPPRLDTVPEYPAPSTAIAGSPAATAADQGSSMEDFGRGLLVGGAQLVGALGDIPSFATGGVIPSFSEASGINKFTEEQRKHYQPETTRQMRALQEAEGFWGTLSAIPENIGGAGQYMTESLPSVIPGIGAASAASRVAQGAKLASGAGKSAAQAAGVQAATRAGVATESAIGGGFAGQQAAQSIRDMPPDKLGQLEDFRELIDAGSTPEAAREELANRAAQLALPIGALTGAIGGAIGAPIEARLVSGLSAGKSGPISSAVSTVATQGGEELVQESGEQMASNYGVGRVDPKQELLEGVPESAALGLALGAGSGAGLATVGEVARQVRGKSDTKSSDATKNVATGDVAGDIAKESKTEQQATKQGMADLYNDAPDIQMGDAIVNLGDDSTAYRVAGFNDDGTVTITNLATGAHEVKDANDIAQDFGRLADHSQNTPPVTSASEPPKEAKNQSAPAQPPESSAQLQGQAQNEPADQAPSTPPRDEAQGRSAQTQPLSADGETPSEAAAAQQQPGVEPVEASQGSQPPAAQPPAAQPPAAQTQAGRPADSSVDQAKDQSPDQTQPPTDQQAQVAQPGAEQQQTDTPGRVAQAQEVGPQADSAQTGAQAPSTAQPLNTDQTLDAPSNTGEQQSIAQSARGAQQEQARRVDPADDPQNWRRIGPEQNEIQDPQAIDQVVNEVREVADFKPLDATSTRTPKAKGQASASTQSDAAVQRSQQRLEQDAQAANVEPDVQRAQSADNFKVHYEQRPTGKLNVGIDRVATPEDAAHVFAPIRKRAQETMMAMVTDEDGKILNVISHTQGLKASSSVDPLTLASAIAATPGGKNVWFGHNHPGGNTRPSPSDYRITNRLSRAMDGTNINVGGHVVVGADGTAVVFNPGDSVAKDITINPAPRKKSAPVTERMLVRRDYKSLEPITSQAKVLELAESMEAEDALIMLDNQNKLVGTLAMSAADMTALRKDGRVNRILSGIDATNANNFIVKTNDPVAAKNMIRFLKNAGADSNSSDVLDWLYRSPRTGKWGGVAQSPANSMLHEDGPFFSRKGLTGQGDAQTDAEQGTPAFSRMTKAQQRRLQGEIEEGASNLGTPVETDAAPEGQISNQPPEAIEDADQAQDAAQEAQTQPDVQFKTTVPTDVDDAISYDGLTDFVGVNTFKTNRDFKVAIQARARELAAKAGVDLAARDSNTEEYLVRIGLKDALYALRTNPNAVGWYDKTVKKAMNILALVHPELATDEDARLAFTWALAVTSNGIKVDKNFDMAERAYQQYKQTGKMPTDIGAGTAATAINNSLGLFNRLQESIGFEGLHDLANSMLTVGELKRAGYTVTGEAVNTVVRGGAVMGPKIGNGFFSNLQGYFDQLTMDRWFIRTTGRWTGTLIEDRPDMEIKKRSELRAAFKATRRGKRLTAKVEAALGFALPADPTDDDLNTLAFVIQKKTVDADVRKALSGPANDIRLAGNGLATYLDGQKEAPDGPKERDWWRKVIGRVLGHLQDDYGHEALTMADLQALVWYPERRLFDRAVSDKNIDEGYNDDEAPDYANAAAGLAKSRGVSQSDINNVISEVENGRTARARRGAGKGLRKTQSRARQGALGVAVRDALGRIPSTKRILPGGSSAKDTEKPSRAYRVRSKRASGQVRLSDGQTLTPVQQFEPVAKVTAALDTQDISSPVFSELDPTKDASVFHKLITAAKGKDKAGAAVHVYDAGDYESMRLFVTDDGTAGFALKGQDIVSVFKANGSSHNRFTTSMLFLATDEGGRTLDAFDTVLPDLYADAGFRVVSRIPWDQEEMPEGWDKDFFKRYNKGEPDVVFMVYDGGNVRPYQSGDGIMAASYDDAVALQLAELERLRGELGPKFSRAYHGSPHDHDAFSMHAIGSGEGAQAYGYGLYFTDTKEIAEYYKNVLSEDADINIDGQLFNASYGNGFYNEETETLHRVGSPEHDAILAVMEAEGDVKKAYSVMDAEFWSADEDGDADMADHYAEAGNFLKDNRTGKYTDIKLPGRVYEVELAPKSEDYLDWDKPLGEQSAKVKAAFIAALDAYKKDQGASDRFIRDKTRGATGGDIYKLLAMQYGAKETSELLAKQDIPGIRYLDGSSRRQGKGRSNYVIFDDKLIDIVAKFSRRAKSSQARKPSTQRKVSDRAKQAIQTLNDAIAKYLDTPSEASGAQATVPNGANKRLAAAIGKALGKTVVFYDAKPDAFLNDINGVSLPEQNDVLFVNNDSASAMAVTGHEFLHSLKRDDPELYEWAKARLLPHIKNQAKFRKALDKARDAEGYPPAPDSLIVEELIANAMGDMFLEPAFWAQVAQDDGTLFQRFLKRAIVFLNKVLRNVAPGVLDSRDYFRDIEHTRNVLADMLKAYQQRQQPEAFKGKTAAGRSFSRQLVMPSTDPFYSALTRAAEKADGAPKSANAQQWVQWLDGQQRKGLIKAEERAWIGIDEWLADQKGKITRDQIQEFTRDNQLVIEESVLSSAPDADSDQDMPLDDEDSGEDSGEDSSETVYGEYTMPGGENYQELLLILPNTNRGAWKPSQDEIKINTLNSEISALMDSMKSIGDNPEERAKIQGQINSKLAELSAISVKRSSNVYQSEHWDEENVVAHIRTNERKGPAGERILFIEEIQSDWHQDGRRMGYGPQPRAVAKPNPNGDGFVVFDNKNNMVVRQGELSFDSRSEAEKHIQDTWGSADNMIVGAPDAPFKKSWPMLAMKRAIRYAAENDFDRIAWTTGKVQASRYFEHGNPDANDKRRKGMTAFYDQMLPNETQKFIKKWGAKVGTVDLSSPNGKKTQPLLGRRAWAFPGFTITPRMRDQVLSEGAPLFNRNQIGTKPFKNWFGDSKVLDEDGEPLRLYHGTSMDFWRFNKNKADPEGDMGAGFYFTNSADDSSGNYASHGGPDIKNRIEAMAERLDEAPDDASTDDAMDWDHDKAVAYVTEKFLDHKGAVMPVYLKMENPAYIGGDSETYLTYEEEYNEEVDDYEEPTGTLVDFIEALHNNAGRYDDANVEAAASSLFERAIDGDVPLSEIFKILKNNEEFTYAMDDEGRMAYSELIRESLEDAGFDGIIDSTVSEKFSNMGLPDDAVHYIAFNPTQIKSAIGNTGEFDADNPDIRFSRRKPADNPQVESFRKKIGRPPPAPWHRRLAEYLRTSAEDLKNDKKDSLRASTLDQYYGIQRAERRAHGNIPAEQSGYVAARMANNVSSVMRGILEHGGIKWESGIPKQKAGVKGLMPAFNPVAAKGELDDFLEWMIAERADRLMGEKRENLFEAGEIAAVKATADALPGRRARWEQARKDYADLQTSILDFAQEAGLIDPTTRPLWENADYIPFYRVDAEQGVLGASKRSGLEGQSSGIKRLKGGAQNVNDPLENILMNMTHLVDASLKNQAMRRTRDNLNGIEGVMTPAKGNFKPEVIPLAEVKKSVAKSLLDQGMTRDEVKSYLSQIPADAWRGMRKMMAYKIPDAPNVVRVMENGKPQYFEVDDPLLLRGLSSLDAAFGWRDNIVGQAMMGAKRLLTATVTVTPTFALRNFVRDTLAAGIITESKFIPVIDSWKGITSSLDPNHATNRAMTFAGASFLSSEIAQAGSAGKAAGSVRRQLNRLNKDDTLARASGIAERVWHRGYRQFTDAMENANRNAVYEAALKRGASEAQAAYEALDIMDFTLRGDSLTYNFFADVVPFLNARVQGMYRLGRAPKTSEGRWNKQFVVGSTFLTLASLGLYIANKAFHADELDELEDWDRDANYHVYVGGQHITFPKPFELGFLFGTIPERVAEVMTEKDSTFKRFVDRVKTGMFETLSFNPTPQLIKPMYEVWNNKDSFTGRDIVSTAEAGRQAEDQYGASTSQLSRNIASTLSPAARAARKTVGVGESLELSPDQIDHLIRGYLGAVGIGAVFWLDAADRAIRRIGSEPIASPAEMRIDQYPVVRAFYRADPETRNRYKTELYDLYRDVDKTVKSLSFRTKEQLFEGARNLVEEQSEDLRIHGAIKGAMQSMRDVRAAKRQIRNDRSMTPAQKRERIDELDVRAGMIAKQGVQQARQVAQ